MGHLWHLIYKLLFEIINGKRWFHTNISNFAVTKVAACSQTLFRNRTFTRAVTTNCVHHISMGLTLEWMINYLLGNYSSYHQYPAKVKSIYCYVFPHENTQKCHSIFIKKLWVMVFIWWILHKDQYTKINMHWALGIYNTCHLGANTFGLSCQSHI